MKNSIIKNAPIPFPLKNLTLSIHINCRLSFIEDLHWTLGVFTGLFSIYIVMHCSFNEDSFKYLQINICSKKFRFFFQSTNSHLHATLTYLYFILLKTERGNRLCLPVLVRFPFESTISHQKTGKEKKL